MTSTTSPDSRPGGIVYTGLGALYWLPDIGRWAEVVASLLRPGGFLYLDEPDAGSYADPQASVQHTRSIEFVHGLGEVVTALAAAGLRIDFLHEHDYTLWQRFSVLERDGTAYRPPEGRPRVPLMYSVRAAKPSP
ncbi:hypothetical protein [Actinomadura monticuli]|uniref:Class I SAM-dependent methyltransferase n=1 Tax=Actinomadura monticuli TaxID=3097367 RepID=A0ABV4QG49_9ACTN